MRVYKCDYACQGESGESLTGEMTSEQGFGMMEHIGQRRGGGTSLGLYLTLFLTSDNDVLWLSERVLAPLGKQQLSLRKSWQDSVRSVAQTGHGWNDWSRNQTRRQELRGRYVPQGWGKVRWKKTTTKLLE